MIYKRADSKYYYVTATRESTKTTNRKLAEEFARKAIERRWRKEALGESRKTWIDLANDWRDAKAHKTTMYKDEQIIAQMTILLQRRKIEFLDEITDDVMAQYMREQKAQSSPATANRHANTLRAMFARAWDKRPRWVADPPNIEKYMVVEKEVKPVTVEQYNEIARLLPDNVRTVADLALETGLRQANIVDMLWDWVSPCFGYLIVPAGSAKSRRTITVPLSSSAQEILRKLGECRSTDRVFPTLDVNAAATAWYRAKTKAGVSARFHDLRHTWATRHTQNGTPDRILAKLGGWSGTQMLKKYSHLDINHLSQFANNGAPNESVTNKTIESLDKKDKES